MDLSNPGKRLYAIRLQYGDGSRKAEALIPFAKRVKRVTGEHFDPGTLSLLERMEQKWRIEDAEILCQLDKEKRGKIWLAFGPETEVLPEQNEKKKGKAS